MNERTDSARPRLVTVPIWGGGRMTIPCPAWCTRNHDLDSAEHPLDVAHSTDEISVQARDDAGEVHVFLSAQVVQYPHDQDPRPRLAMAGDDQDFAGYDLEGVDKLLGRLEVHLTALRGLREQLAAAVAEEAGR